MKKLFLICSLILAISFDTFAQEKGIQNNTLPSLLPAPPSPNTETWQNDPAVENYMSRFFGVAFVGGFSVGPRKSFLNTPGTLTIVSSTARNIFGGAFSGTGVWYGLEYLAAGSGNLVTIDTTTGAFVTIGSLTGLAGGHTVTGLSWDKTTSTMYGLSTNGTAGTLYTVNLATGAMTVVGNTTGSNAPIDMSFNNAGVLYSTDIGTDVLNTINKSTGAATTVGPLGIDLNYAQGMCFDPSTDSLFLAAYILPLPGVGRLYRCNTATGATTLVGNFGTVSTELDGFAIPGLGQPPLPLNPFNLQTPVAGARIVTIVGSTTPVSITWDTSASGATYKFIFGNPIVPPRRLTINAGVSNSISTTLGDLDAILAANGFTNNGTVTDSAVGQWNVWAFKGPGATGVDSLVSTNGPLALTFRRQQLTLGPLNQDFVDVTFPPPLWGLDAGGGATQYWTRDAVGGYNVGVGSAKYNFWDASSTTPLQSLTSNEFLPVTSPNNYLRFNYTHAFYLASGVLADDSCMIETSTNNGTTWANLITMKASQTISSGYNSSNIMTTVGGPVVGAFTPTLASQWATKIYSMPVGTNKVRFVAKSDFGNNLYIDNITSGTITGVGNNVLTLIPEKFDLSQNYPNPFNPVTKINFSLPKQTQVTLRVYDILGKEVATLVNEVKPAGNYNVNFNASNISSGIYFYKIEAENFTDIKRMMLIK